MRDATVRLSGPLRYRQSYVRQTRVIAAVALAALVAAVLSDFFARSFWTRHPLTAGVVASTIVVMFSVAVVNEVVEHRRRRHWRVLAQYVMFELGRNARQTWAGILGVAGLLPDETSPAEALDAGERAVRDTPALTVAVRKLLAEPHGREQLHRELVESVSRSDVVLSRWAAVMLNADAYAELVDRHVELASATAWLIGLLNETDSPVDLRRRLRVRFTAAVPADDVDDDALAERVVMIAQLAEELDETTFDIALRVVPLQWWRARLASRAPTERTPVRAT